MLPFPLDRDGVYSYYLCVFVDGAALDYSLVL